MAEKKPAPKKKKTEKAPVEETVAEATDVVEEAAPVEEPVAEEAIVDGAPAPEAEAAAPAGADEDR